MTETVDTPPPSQMPLVGRLSFGDMIASLKSGIYDFSRAPLFGLFFSAVYVVVGFILVSLGAGHVSWVLVTSLGFPLAAPFAAVGLYEVSRRLEAGKPLLWREVLGVVWQERTRQIPWLGAVIVIYFLFWTFLAHMIFAVFMGLAVMTSVSTSLEVFLTPQGLTMIAVELGIGAVLAFLLFSLTVISLPLVLEKEIDFVSAMLLSLRTVASNLPMMLIWAAIIAIVSLVALAPYFLGLMIALPIFGHATWHLYRRVLYDPV